MSRGLYDEDGIDGPFERAMDQAMRDDEAARTSKPCCPMCWTVVEAEWSFCGPTCLEAYDRFQEGGSV